MVTPVQRQPISAVIRNKPELEAINGYHVSRGDTHMSMTRILEELIDKEFKRLRLKRNVPAT